MMVVVVINHDDDDDISKEKIAWAFWLCLGCI